ncbi:copper amine oxidase N-terminal domain-containing protein [Paenibacillus sp. OV219]|uniref:copper amine oxidase N-terminal domain-containing protein n=1 Tax=Paenibacillus sp. OV219 TaxID=1884377 RepID=UPI0015A6A967|nr:copper amine oxidase N-terminal domain-containing protein [Paenibacillus sp. OV219]
MESDGSHEFDGQLQNSAIMVQGRTLVQLRSLDDPAWLTYAYDAKTGTVTARSKDNRKIVLLQAGQKTATVDGKRVTLDTTIVNKDGRTYVPLRFISESLGAYVDYNSKDKRAIVRTPVGQTAFNTLMRGDLTEARKLVTKLSRIIASNALQPNGEGFTVTYTFPEGEALRFTEDYKGLTSYFEVNADGLPVAKWQQDSPLLSSKQREWGTKPVGIGSKVYFSDMWMTDGFAYGKIDAEGKVTELGNFNRLKEPKYKNVVIVPIEGEKRVDTKS